MARPHPDKNYLGGQHLRFLLDRAAKLVWDAFPDAMGLLHVGSSLSQQDFRDVDVRLVLADDEYDRLFGVPGARRDGLWTLLCMTTSRWMSGEVGLPVDFQIQRLTESQSHRDEPRNGLGILPSYPGELPSSLDANSKKED